MFYFTWCLYSSSLHAFKVYVKAILEYASCTWSPHHILKIQQVETVQRKFTKRLPGYAPLCNKQMLSRLDLESLEMRRLQHDLIYSYKIVFNQVSESANDMFTLANSLYSTRTRGTLLTLCIQLELEAIRTNYTFIIVLLMQENIYLWTYCDILRHQNTFKYLVR